MQVVMPRYGKTGHSHIKNTHENYKSATGRGNVWPCFIKDGFYGFDDALYVGIRVLCQMAKTGQSYY